MYFSLSAPPNAPTITSLISAYSDQLTVTWTSVPTATSYSVSINSSSSTPVPITSSGPLQNTFTGLTNNTVYTVSVMAINCAGNSSAVITGRTSTCILSKHILTISQWCNLNDAFHIPSPHFSSHPYSSPLHTSWSKPSCELSYTQPIQIILRTPQ